MTCARRDPVFSQTPTHTHVCKRMWSGRRIHLKITTSAGSGKKWQVCCTPNGDSAPHGLERCSFVLTDTTRNAMFKQNPFGFSSTSRDTRGYSYDIYIWLKSKNIRARVAITSKLTEINIYLTNFVISTWYIFRSHLYREETLDHCKNTK